MIAPGATTWPSADQQCSCEIRRHCWPRAASSGTQRHRLPGESHRPRRKLPKLSLHPDRAPLGELASQEDGDGGRTQTGMSVPLRERGRAVRCDEAPRPDPLPLKTAGEGTGGQGAAGAQRGRVIPARCCRRGRGRRGRWGRARLPPPSAAFPAVRCRRCLS